tara:strand:+ start:56 stop:403 length:348 start_codon:yes stop_codon:yes gene_type:complete
MIKCCTHDKTNSDNTQIPSGILMKFENGNSISIQWGYFNYCSNRNESSQETLTAEIMICDATGKAHSFGNDSVKGWCTADEVAKWISFAQGNAIQGTYLERMGDAIDEANAKPAK